MDKRPLLIASALLLTAVSLCALPADAASDTVTVRFAPVDGIDITFIDGIPVGGNVVRIDRGGSLTFVAHSERYDLSASGIHFYGYDVATGTRGGTVTSANDPVLIGYDSYFTVDNVDRDLEIYFHSVVGYPDGYDPYPQADEDPEEMPVTPSPAGRSPEADPAAAVAAAALSAAAVLTWLCWREYGSVVAAGRVSA